MFIFNRDLTLLLITYKYQKNHTLIMFVPSSKHQPLGPDIIKNISLCNLSQPTKIQKVQRSTHVLSMEKITLVGHGKLITCGSTFFILSKTCK